jgi:protein-tyrosine phosphatase
MTLSLLHLHWDGCHNVRDLGGLPTVDGQETQSRTLIRADLLGRLSTKGKQQLLDYGVSTIIDLRAPQEIAEHPPANFADLEPHSRAPQYANPPQENPRLEQGSAPAAAELKKARTRAELFIKILDLYPGNQASILRAIAGAGPGPIVFHCHSGKDRTGLTAALILSLAGVQESAIAADYAASQANLMPRFQQRVAAGKVDPDDRWAIPLTDPQTIIDTLAHLRSHYGGTEAYLRFCGLTKEELTRLKAKLVG